MAARNSQSTNDEPDGAGFRQSSAPCKDSSVPGHL